MAEKSQRRLKLEASLAEDPADTFLRYGVAMQCLTEGDLEEGRRMLRALIVDHPDDQVAAYHQLGRSLVETEEIDEARRVLQEGIRKARARGDYHAAGEMEELVNQVG